MSNSAIAPVIAGLAAGIGFVILFSALSDGVQPIVYPHFTTTIEGLKDSYSVGEPIDFVVKVTGYGSSCGYPYVSIKNADTGQIVWSPERFVFPLCDSTPRQHNVTWMPKDWGNYPIVIDKEGSYFVEAEFDKKVRQDFVVIEDVDSAVDDISSVTFGHELTITIEELSSVHGSNDNYAGGVFPDKEE